jgi:hypothetical protein
VPLTDGIARESLSSLYAVFGQARAILRRYGPEVAEPKPDEQYNFGYLTVALLNFAFRPMLSYWHPELQAWEVTRSPGTPVKAHEDAWDRIGTCAAISSAPARPSPSMPDCWPRLWRPRPHRGRPDRSTAGDLTSSGDARHHRCWGDRSWARRRARGSVMPPTRVCSQPLVELADMEGYVGQNDHRRAIRAMRTVSRKTS